ncbi:MAG: serine/threonine protein kinase [Acidobacteriota bacterium]|nr:serine/threonine protein kinase [Acidobacteriota bacterium]
MPDESGQQGSYSRPGPGTVLDGKYEILSRIGAGGMGEVFKARHVHLNTFRCIKVMKQALLADDVFLTRFLREARLATQIHHPNIAAVHDFFIGEGGNYMVTEFIDGTTLRQWAAAHGPFPVALAADVVSQILSGLDHIHRRGLLHRDISPDNVMLSFDEDDRLIAKIIDLGIAKDVNTTSAEMTQAGVLIGNPKYMSPEQLGMLGDDEQIDGRADLYCLGVVFYEMLAGVAAFASETPQGYIMKHLTQTPPRFAVAKHGIAVPDRMEQIIFRVLEKDRRRRFESARELADALASFLTAPAGTLHRDDIARLRRGPEKTISQPMPMLGPDDATIAETPSAMRVAPVSPPPKRGPSTEAKALEFELSLLADVQAREGEGDRQALQRLGEAHPRGTRVGDAARDAIHRLAQAQQRDREEEEQFQRAWEDGRASVWRTFIEEHPNSPRAARAQELLDEALGFERAATGDSETDIRQFLSVWPEGRHHLEAEIRLVALRQRLAADAFAEALAADTQAAMHDFLKRFGLSAHVEEARRIAEERQAFENAAATDTEASWNAYLGKWIDDRHAADAHIRHDRAVKRAKAKEEEANAQSEPKDFDEAWEGGTSAAWDRYLSKHATSNRIAEARRCRQEAADFEQAVAANIPAMWRAFLKTWPEGRHRMDAALRVKGR